MAVEKLKAVTTVVVGVGLDDTELLKSEFVERWKNTEGLVDEADTQFYGAPDQKTGDHRESFEKIDKLKDRILNFEYQGLLVVWVPNEAVETAERHLVYGKADILHVAARIKAGKKWRGIKPFPTEKEQWRVSSVLNWMALAHLLHEAGGCAVIILGTEGKIESRSEDLRSIHAAVFDHEKTSQIYFKVASEREVTTENQGKLMLESLYFESLKFRRKAGYGRARLTFASNYPSEILGPEYQDSDYGAWSFSREKEFHTWLEREFERRHLRELFKTGFDVDERSRLVLFSAIRICADLSYATLEGIPFTLRVFIPKYYKKFANSPKLGKSEKGSPEVFALKNEVYLNYDYQDRVRDLFELAQSNQLFILVKPHTGEITSIHTWPTSTESFDLHRQFRILRTIDQPGVMIAVGGDFGGVTEVYTTKESGNSSLRFYREGLRWRESPLDRLQKLVSESFFDHGRGDESDKLCSAFLYLLENRLSSIIVLIATADLDAHNLAVGSEDDFRHSLEDKGFQIFRSEVTCGEENLIKNFSFEGLAALFKVDGVHFVSDTGLILGIGFNYVAGGTNDNVSGSGTSAALSVSSVFQNSAVLKVSASSSIKICYQGKILPELTNDFEGIFST